MIVTFFGHSDFKENDEFEKIILDLLEKKIGGVGERKAFLKKFSSPHKKLIFN